MTESQKDAVLVAFIESLRDHKSWSGETHVQKGTYFLQELLAVPMGFEFILYKHGPYSFDLKNELTSQMADGLLMLKPRSPYGPSILPGENSSKLLERFPKTRNRFRRQIEFVASRLGPRDVSNLERVATALFITRNDLPEGDVAERAVKIREIKPHISLDLAVDAVNEIDQLIAEAEEYIVTSE